MPRWNPSRWFLGATALVAVAVAGCGAISNRPRLRATAEKRLLFLVARARGDAARHDRTAVHAVLGEFVSQVETLRTSGQLNSATARTLARQARSAAFDAAAQVHTTAQAANSGSDGTGTPTTEDAAPPAAAGPAAKDRPKPDENVKPPEQPGPGPKPDAHGDHGGDAGSASPGAGADAGPGGGHAHGHDHSPGQNGSGSASPWNYLTGSGGD